MLDLSTILTLIFSSIVTVATVVIALATKKYVQLNASLVEETKLLRKAQTDPRISVYMRQKDSDNVIVDLIVRNDSQAQARNLRFQVDPDIYYFKNRKLSDIDFLQYLPSLQPNESRTLRMFTGSWKAMDNSESSVPETTTISVTYEDVAGNEKEDKFPIPLRSYTHGETWTQDTPLDKMAKSLMELERTAKTCLQYIQARKSDPD
jgi:hypothetical protein